LLQNSHHLFDCIQNSFRRKAHKIDQPNVQRYVKPVFVYCVSVPCLSCSYHKLYCTSNKWPTQERHSY